MVLTVHRPPDPDEFLAQAGPFLAAREAEHNLQFGILSALRDQPQLFAEPPRFAVVTNEAGAAVAAALQTPPHNLVVSQVADPEAIEALVEALAEEPLPGVLAPHELAGRFTSAFEARTGRRAHLEAAERIFRLQQVTPPARPAVGSWRMADQRDRELVADWIVAFAVEAMPEQPPPPDPLETADRWIAGTSRDLYLWQAGDRVVSVVGTGGQTPNGIRIGPVYTPPEHRGRGYASSLTAAASQDQLHRGRRFCFLFTDLANPTSNKIYHAIGYEPVCDMDMYRFDPPREPAG